MINKKPVLIGLGLFLAGLLLFNGYSASDTSKSEIADSLALDAANKLRQDSLDAAQLPVVKASNNQLRSNENNGSQYKKQRGKGKGNRKKRKD